MYKFDTSHTYFDCTNFYFEIDKEDDFRKKGSSKENRKEPIVGLGLLLDANQIPIGMKLFPGNQSEKPVIRKVINDLKKRNSISGRTIQIADMNIPALFEPPVRDLRVLPQLSVFCFQWIYFCDKILVSNKGGK